MTDDFNLDTDTGDTVEERFITRRIVKLVYLAFITILSGVLLGILHGLTFDRILSIVFVDVLFSVLFAFYLESSRMHCMDKPDSSEDYMRMCVYYTACAAFTVAGSFFPEYTAPVLILAFLLSAGLDQEQAAVTALFLDIQLTWGGEMAAGELAFYLMMTLLGIILTNMYEQKEHRRYAEMIALALCVAMPVLFYYVDHGLPTIVLLLFSFLNGALSMLGMHFLYEGIHFRQVQATEISMDTIVDPNYHLVREIKKYSQADYNHAIRVSRIAAHCAAHVGADVKVAAVGGFYYRLGRLGGEPFIENGVKIAQNNCFPNEIIQILSEYNGKRNAISTIESAIVHITDTVVTKFDLLDNTTLSSSWNRDIVIYQSLNEKSSSGIYDNSGLSMNQFLKIREFLAKEEELL